MKFVAVLLLQKSADWSENLFFNNCPSSEWVFCVSSGGRTGCFPLSLYCKNNVTLIKKYSANSCRLMRSKDIPGQKSIHKLDWTSHDSAIHIAIGRNPMSASSPPSLPRAFLHSLYPHHPSLPSTPSPSPSPPGPLYTRLSNDSHSAPSPTNSRSSFHGVSFLLQIGLTRETVNLEASDLSLSAVKDLVCSIVDQKVRTYWKKKLYSNPSPCLTMTNVNVLSCIAQWKCLRKRMHTHIQLACFQT